MPDYLDEIEVDNFDSRYTTGQVAKILGVSSRIVAKWLDKEELKGYRIPGGNRYTTHEYLIEFAKEYLGINILKGEVYYRIGRMANVCGVSNSQIVKHFDDGDLKGFSIPGSKFRYISRTSLIEFAKEQKIYDYTKWNLGILD